MVTIEPLLMNRGLDLSADSDAQRLTSDLSEQSPAINFWGNIAAGMSKELNYKFRGNSG